MKPCANRSRYNEEEKYILGRIVVGTPWYIQRQIWRKGQYTSHDNQFNKGICPIVIPQLQWNWWEGMLVSPYMYVGPSVCAQNGVRSALVGSITYLHIFSTNSRRCLAYRVFQSICFAECFCFITAHIICMSYDPYLWSYQWSWRFSRFSRFSSFGIPVFQE